MIVWFLAAALGAVPVTHPRTECTVAVDLHGRPLPAGTRRPCSTPTAARRKKRTPSRRSRSDPAVAILAMRHAILHDFLVETRSEAPKFVDARTVIVHGLAVGPTTVDVDFVGSPIVRASVVNQAARSACALLRADVRDANGHTASGSTWVESLAQGGTRAIEVLVPGMLDPVAVRWSATDLGGC